MKITLIALTHYHGDHILGLPGLLQTLDTMGRQTPLYLTGPEDGHEAILGAIMTLADELSYPVHFLPVPPEGLFLRSLDPCWPPEIRLTAFPTMHRIASQGYRLDVPRARKLDAEKAAALGIPKSLWRTLQQGQAVTVDGRTIHPDAVCCQARPGLTAVYTGDTAPCEAIVHAAGDADLLIMDATYPDDTHTDKAALYGHATFSQAAALAAATHVKRLWLTHYSAMIANPEEFLPAARTVFPHTECGMDGKCITLTFRSGEM